jgi:hypothetical protein
MSTLKGFFENISFREGENFFTLSFKRLEFNGFRHNGILSELDKVFS